MTRIVSGFAGSLALTVPRVGTRPTSDRVREAIFSSLDARDRVRGAHVLDLYAGSGALGLEAASRGAADVVLVERNSSAARVCARNAAAIERAAPGGPPRIAVITSAVRTFLAGRAQQHGDVSLAFLDPPYDLPDAALAEDLSLLADTLADDAVIVVERSSRSSEPSWPAGVTLETVKRYGETSVWTASFQPERPSQPL